MRGVTGSFDARTAHQCCRLACQLWIVGMELPPALPAERTEVTSGLVMCARPIPARFHLHVLCVRARQA